MPARIVWVHDDPEFDDEVTNALRQAGHGVAAFLDPMPALNALEEAQRAELLNY